MRLALLSLILFVGAYCIASHASACPGPGYEEGVIFESVPKDVKPDELVAEVEITPASGVHDNPDGPENLVGMGRIISIIQGDFEGTEIAIFTYLATCSQPFKFGTTGIVVGSLKKASDGAWYLNARAESENAKLRKRNAESAR